MMKIIINIALISSLFAITNLAHAQLDLVKQYAREVSQQSAYPGFAVVLVDGQRVVWAEGFGKVSLGKPEPMTADTPLAIGSFTKSFTAMALMQMAEEGLVDLDVPVVTYLPWFQTAIKAKSDHITLRMLLSNSSGLPSLDLGIGEDHRDEKADTRLVKQLNSCVLNREPGSSFEYSNEGFAVAGLVGATVSGMDFKDYMQQRVLTPLAMSNSSTDLKRLEVMGTSLGHRHGIDRGIPAQTTLSSMAYAAAGSVMHCSARDLGHYLIALLNGGTYQGTQVLSTESRDTLWREHINMPEDPDAEAPPGYGLGWMLSVVDGRRVVHHGGATGTMTSYALLEPERGTAVAILSNIPGLDRFQNTGLSTLANNILHLYHGEPTSLFGTPKERDFTQNNFELPLEKRKAYLGTYLAKGLSNYALHIEQNPAGQLIAREMTGQELTGTSTLDFLNPSRVALRSIGGAQIGHFKLTLQGKVYGFSLGGGQLYKREVDQKSAGEFLVQTEHFAFRLPPGWLLTSEGDVVEARSTVDTTLSLRAFVQTEAANEPNLTELFPNQPILHQGAVHHETLKPNTWRQQSLLVEKKGQQTAYLLLTTPTDTGTLYLMFSATRERLTTQIQQVVFPLIKSLSINRAS